MRPARLPLASLCAATLRASPLTRHAGRAALWRVAHQHARSASTAAATAKAEPAVKLAPEDHANHPEDFICEPLFENIVNYQRGGKDLDDVLSQLKRLVDLEKVQRNPMQQHHLACVLLQRTFWRVADVEKICAAVGLSPDNAVAVWRRALGHAFHPGPSFRINKRLARFNEEDAAEAVEVAERAVAAFKARVNHADTTPYISPFPLLRALHSNPVLPDRARLVETVLRAVQKGARASPTFDIFRTRSYDEASLFFEQHNVKPVRTLISEANFLFALSFPDWTPPTHEDTLQLVMPPSLVKPVLKQFKSGKLFSKIMDIYLDEAKTVFENALSPAGRGIMVPGTSTKEENAYVERVRQSMLKFTDDAWDLLPYSLQTAGKSGRRGSVSVLPRFYGLYTILGEEVKRSAIRATMQSCLPNHPFSRRYQEGPGDL